MKPFVLADAPVSGKDEDRRERETVRAESTIVLEKGGWTVALPRTERAACWWGRGTRWCTAATDSHNMFERYNQNGALVVIVRPDGEKFQFHASGGDFMDAADRSASAIAVLTDTRWSDGHSLAHLLSQDAGPDEQAERVAHRHALLTAMVPFEAETAEFVAKVARLEVGRIAIMDLGLEVRRLPHRERSLDYESCLHAVATDSGAIQFVPVHLLDQPLCLAAVQRSGYALQNVPDSMKTEEVCKAAVAKTGEALQYVPTSLLTREVCAVALAESEFALRHVPPELIDRDMCLDAVRRRGTILSLVPEGLRDEEMCREAVHSNGHALGHVPPDLMSRSLILAAVRRSWNAIDYVPAEQRDKEVYLEMVSGEGLALQDVPVEILDADICAAAVSNNPSALQYVPHEHITRDMCVKAVSRSWNAICCVPEDMKDLEICLIAGRSNYLATKYFPDKIWKEAREILRQVKEANANISADPTMSAPSP